MAMRRDSAVKSIASGLTIRHERHMVESFQLSTAKAWR